MLLTLLSLIAIGCARGSVTLNGIYSDAACTTNAGSSSLASLNLLMGLDACVVVPGIGSGKVVAHSGAYAVTGYSDNSCTTAAATFSHVALNACTNIGDGSTYIKLSPTVQILGTYIGASCSGSSFSSASVNAVGANGRAACTTSGSNSIKIEMDAGGSTMTLLAYTAAACSGSAISTWAGVSGGSGTCAASTSGSSVAMSFGGLGASLPAPTAPTATPTPAPPSPSPSPAVAPQKVALLGVYKDASCTMLYDGVPKLDAVGTVGACSGLPGLGGGLITLASASAQTFDVKGYSTGDGSGDRCANTALAAWKNVRLNTCTKSTAELPLGYGYVLLAPALDIHYVASSTGCAAANKVFDSVTAAVGVTSPACTRLRPSTGSVTTGSVTVQQTAAGGFTIKGFLGSTTCEGGAPVTFTAALNACSNADSSQASIQLGGLASAAQSFYAPTEAISVALTLPATASAAALTLASVPLAMKAELISLVSYLLGVNSDFVAIVSVTAVGARRARALAASGYTFTFAVNTAALAVATGINGASSSSVAVNAQASLLAAINGGQMGAALNTMSSVKSGLGNPTFSTATMFAAASAAPAAPKEEDNLPLGLGVGLGVGVPVVFAVLYYSVVVGLKCGKKPVGSVPQKGMVINVPQGATVVIQQGGAANGGTAV